LLNLTAHDLREEMKIRNLGLRKRLQQALEEVRHRAERESLHVFTAAQRNAIKKEPTTGPVGATSDAGTEGIAFRTAVSTCDKELQGQKKRKRPSDREVTQELQELGNVQEAKDAFSKVVFSEEILEAKPSENMASKLLMAVKEQPVDAELLEETKIGATVSKLQTPCREGGQHENAHLAAQLVEGCRQGGSVPLSKEEKCGQERIECLDEPLICEPTFNMLKRPASRTLCRQNHCGNCTPAQLLRRLCNTPSAWHPPHDSHPRNKEAPRVLRKQSERPTAGGSAVEVMHEHRRKGGRRGRPNLSGSDPNSRRNVYSRTYHSFLFVYKREHRDDYDHIVAKELARKEASRVVGPNVAKRPAADMSTPRLRPTAAS